MSKKNILSAVLATSLLLVSCGGRDDDYVAINNQGGMITPPNNSIPTPPSPQSPPQNPPQNQPQKPAESYMGSRSVARWKKEITPDIYFGAIDIADLIQNKGKFNIDFLKNYITIHSTEPDGSKYYEFQEEDFSKVEILDLEYSQNQITFYTKYNGYTSTIKSSLSFNEREFYDRKILVNKSYVSQNYMRGIYERGSMGIGNIFNYDESRLEIEIVDKNLHNYSNSLDYTLKITDKKINREVSLNKNVEGFKTLKQLAESMQISPKYELLEAVKTKINSLRNNSIVDLTGYLKGVFTNQKWIQKTEIEVGGVLLEWTDVNTKISLHSLGYQLGIYLENPKFVLNNAELKGNDLHMTIELQYANDVTINKQYKFIVKGVK